jgi:hypothetical protein
MSVVLDVVYGGRALAAFYRSGGRRVEWMRKRDGRRRV